MLRRTLLFSAVFSCVGICLALFVFAQDSGFRLLQKARLSDRPIQDSSHHPVFTPPHIACGNRTAGLFYGLNGHVQQGGAYSESSFEQQISQLNELGATMYRQDVSNAEGARTVASLAKVARARCVEILPVLTPDVQRNQDEAAAYADGYSLGRTAAMNLRGLVTYYEVGNELEIEVLHDGASGDDPRDYDNTKFMKARGSILGMIAGIKELDPSAKIVFCALGWLHYGFSDMLFEGSQPDGTRGHPMAKWDVTAWHWYSDMGSITAAGLSRINVLEYLSKTYHKPIWITEFGVRPDYGGDDPGTYLTGKEALAGYVANAQAYGIQSVVLYELYDDLKFGGDGNYGLIKDDGTTRKPSFEAIRKFIEANRMP
jgi:hypothetical protein